MTRDRQERLADRVDALADELGVDDSGPGNWERMTEAERDALRRWHYCQFFGTLGESFHGADCFPYVKTESGAIPTAIIEYSREAWPLSDAEAFRCLSDEEQAAIRQAWRRLKGETPPPSIGGES